MRYHLPIIIGAALGSLALFWLMIALISSRGGSEAVRTAPPQINFIRIAKEEAVLEKSRAPARPQAQDTPPPPPPPPQNLAPPPLSPEVSASAIGGFAASLAFAAAPIDGDALALVRVLPIYPPRALQRGIEGWVLLEFSLSGEGAPLAPKIIDAEPRGIFDRAALAAVKRWRYRATNNRSDNRPLIRQRIKFQIK